MWVWESHQCGSGRARPAQSLSSWNVYSRPLWSKWPHRCKVRAYRTVAAVRTGRKVDMGHSLEILWQAQSLVRVMFKAKAVSLLCVRKAPLPPGNSRLPLSLREGDGIQQEELTWRHQAGLSRKWRSIASFKVCSKIWSCLGLWVR